MGHRYYTEENLQLFHCIRKLKNEGVLLRDLKSLIPEIQKAKIEMKQKRNAMLKTENTDKADSNFMEALLLKVLRENNSVLEKSICNEVTESIKREMKYLLEAKDQVEENRYKKLDTLIRQQQVYRKEMAKKGMSERVRQVLGLQV